MTRAKVCRALAWGLLVSIVAVNCKRSTGAPDDDRELVITRSGDGSGSVLIGEDDLSCPIICAVLYDLNTEVGLTAVPDLGSTFGGWTGDCTGNSPTTAVTIDEDPACDARFDLDGSEATLTITIDAVGGSTGKVMGTGIDCGDGATDCTEAYPLNSTVHLTTWVPSTSYVFKGWDDDCLFFSGAAEIDLPMTANKSCKARFDVASAALTITIDAAAGSTGKVIGTGIDCGDGATDCTENYPLNSTVHLSAWASSGSLFTGWGDDCLTFTSAAEIDLPMTGDKNCAAQFEVASSGGLQPKGSFSFTGRVEAGALLTNKVIVTGFDDGGQGQIVDVSNIDVLTSQAGAEFSTCSGARGMTTFFSSRPQYNSDVAFTTCTTARQGSTTLATGGFTEIQSFAFAPGKSAHYQLDWLAIADFEFGRLWLRDQSNSPQTPIQINLSPGERSCPFDVTINAGFAYVAGREGEAGTSTENCNNWRGLWKVDLTLNSVVGFTEFGTKLRDVEFGVDNKVYVSDFEEDKVHVINSATMTWERSINVGDGPVGIKLNPMATGMWVTNWNSNKIQYLNLTNDTLIDEEDSGGIHPVDVFISGPNGFVLNFGDAGANIGGSLWAFQHSF